jgi:hypothetical protein
MPARASRPTGLPVLQKLHADPLVDIVVDDLWIRRTTLDAIRRAQSPPTSSCQTEAGAAPAN